MLTTTTTRVVGVDVPTTNHRMALVESVSAVGRAPNASVYRNEHVPAAATNSIVLCAAQPNLIDTMRCTLTAGHWLSEPSVRFPTVVLGAQAARRLGIDNVTTQTQVVIGPLRFAVGGILAQAMTSQAFTGLKLGLGAVGLLVGGIGAPNTTVISVLKRRAEIGLRRPPGADGE